jgi:hypothetical protein
MSQQIDVAEGVKQEAFFDAVMNSEEMTDAQKAEWLHITCADYWSRLVVIERKVREALQVEGAHHKQWYLERIAQVLGVPHNSEGIAP